MDSTNTSIIPIPRNILDDADGFRLNALITAKPKTAITTEGPMTAMNMTIKIRNVSPNIAFPF